MSDSAPRPSLSAEWRARLFDSPWATAATVWLSQRTPRERLFLIAGGAALLIAAYVFLIWQPLARARAATLEHIAVLERVIARAGSIDPSTVNLAAAPVAPATAVTNSAGEFGLAIKRLESEGDATRIELEDAKFDTVLLWLERLEQAHALYASSVELERRPEPGVVAGRMSVGR